MVVFCRSMMVLVINKDNHLARGTVESKKVSFITSQNKLAKAAGVCPLTITRAKSDKFSISRESYTKLAAVTGISVWGWSAGPRDRLEIRLKRFFRKQKEEKILAMKVKKC